MIDPYLVSVLTLWIFFSFYFPINHWECEDTPENTPLPSYDDIDKLFEEWKED